MKDLGKGQERMRNMFREINKHMGKGGAFGTVEEVMDGKGVIHREEEEIITAIEETWKNLLNNEGEAVMGTEKEGVPMEEKGDITELELESAIKKIRLGKAKDEEGLTGEHLRGLQGRAKDRLRTTFNEILRSGQVPDSWNRSRVMLLFKGGERRNFKNYRPVAITSVMYKLFMMIMRERIEGWLEGNNLLSDLQGGFRKGRRTDDNLFLVGRLQEMSAAREEKLLIGCLDLEKAYDCVNRLKLFEVMEDMGIDKTVLRVIKASYQQNVVCFVLGDHRTGWVQATSGVRQGCPLSPTLFNIYTKDVATVLENHPDGMIWRVEDARRIGGLLYADDIALTANSQDGMERILKDVLEVFEEYGMKLSEEKSKIVELVGEVDGEQWIIEGKKIKKTEEVKYLGVKIKGGEDQGIKQLEEGMKKVGSLCGMIKYATKRTGARLIVGREAWKSLVVVLQQWGGMPRRSRRQKQYREDLRDGCGARRKA
jgi:hypothetical protein